MQSSKLTFHIAYIKSQNTSANQLKIIKASSIAYSLLDVPLFVFNYFSLFTNKYDKINTYKIITLNYANLFKTYVVIQKIKYFN